MINTVKSSSSLNDPHDDRRSPRRPPEQEGETQSPPKSISRQSDVRLLIEEDAASGTLIYRLIDRATGEIVSEVSRDDLVKMGADPLYSTGMVVDTKA